MNEAYVGVKFQTVHLPEEKIEDSRVEDLVRIGMEFAAKGFCPKNCGNLSFRRNSGFVITRAGSELGKLTPKDFVIVKDVDIGAKKVFAAGKIEPSSESMMHFLIYGTRPEISVILHGHSLDLKNAVTTRKEYPYATVECAQSATEVLNDRNIIILKGHGFVSVGRTAGEALAQVNGC